MNKKINLKHIVIDKTKDNILIITINSPGSRVNKVSSSLLKEISTIMDKIEKDDSIKGLVILSGKEDNFIVGADVDELKNMKNKKDVISYIEKAHEILNRIERLPIPVVCGIHGNCLGGGLELALVVDYRIASDSTKTVMGLPEVQLGLLPAAGGTQRLPRLIGLREALPLMLQAKNIRVKKAKRIGLIDEITSEFALAELAVKRAVDLSDKKIKKKKRKRSIIDFFLESTPIGKKLVFSKAKEMLMKKTHGLYPAPFKIIDSVETGFKNGIQKGLESDRKAFADLVMSPESKGLMSIFFGMTDLKKNFLEKKAGNVEKLALIGTGLMGYGIASVSTSICDTILMKDVSADAASKGMNEIWKGLEKRVKLGAIARFEKDSMYGRLVPCGDYSFFKSTDLVIEAVFEDLYLKRRVLKEVENATDERTIFASNTSALPISAIAKGCARPENVIGMHYFSPVPRMPLLEIIKTKKTSDRVTATALDFGIKQGKTCIVVKDGPGFYTTRILAPLLFEGGLLVIEGAEMQAVDKAMHLFGYPVGPITLLDEVGIDVGMHVAEGLAPLFSRRGIVSPENFPFLIEKNFLGKKNKRGMYRYDLPKKKGMRQSNKEVYRLFGVDRHREFPVEDIQQRISLMMVNEAVYCLQEGIISSPRDGDMGAILGLGFPPFMGGPFRYIDNEGADKIVKIMEGLVLKHGKRFKPAELLYDMASKDKKFYS